LQAKKSLILLDQAGIGKQDGWPGGLLIRPVVVFGRSRRRQYVDSIAHWKISLACWVERGKLFGY